MLRLDLEPSELHAAPRHEFERDILADLLREQLLIVYERERVGRRETHRRLNFEPARRGGEGEVGHVAAGVVERDGGAFVVDLVAQALLEEESRVAQGAGQALGVGHGEPRLFDGLERTVEGLADLGLNVDLDLLGGESRGLAPQVAQAEVAQHLRGVEQLAQARARHRGVDGPDLDGARGAFSGSLESGNTAAGRWK